MISLARLTLLREWRRFMPAILAVGFAGLLVLMQLVLLLGIFRTVSVYIDRSSADLWVG
jgi:putative ABC transport system permease protein